MEESRLSQDRHPQAASSSAFEPTSPLSTVGWEPTRPVAEVLDAEPTALGPSLLRDLSRFADDPLEADLLPVVAASARHNSPLSLELDLGGTTCTLVLDPARQIYSCEMDLCALNDQALQQLRLVRVKSSASESAEPSAPLRLGSMRPLLWHLALRGAQQELLPELAGNVRCRLTKAMVLTGLPVDGTTKRLMHLMSGAPVTLDDLLEGAQVSRVRVQRVWNALYLQSALMVSRSYPH